MLGRYYVQYFNKNYKRTGTLWEGCYKATLIDNPQVTDDFMSVRGQPEDQLQEPL